MREAEAAWESQRTELEANLERASERAVSAESANTVESARISKLEAEVARLTEELETAVSAAEKLDAAATAARNSRGSDSGDECESDSDEVTFGPRVKKSSGRVKAENAVASLTKKLEAAVEREQSGAAELAAALADLEKKEDEVASASALATTLANKLSTLEAAYTELKARTEVESESVETAAVAVAEEAHQAAFAAESQVAMLTSQLTEANDKVANLESTNAKLAAELAEVASSAESALNSAANEADSVEELRAQVASLTDKLDRSEAKLSARVKRIGEMAVKLQKAQSRIEELESACDTQQAAVVESADVTKQSDEKITLLLNAQKQLAVSRGLSPSNNAFTYARTTLSHVYT